MTIEERLEQLESKLARAQRHNNRLWIALAVVAGGCLTAVPLLHREVLGQFGVTTRTTCEEMRARRFAVVGESGEVLADLSADQAGPHLRLLDKTGNARVGVYSTADGTLLALSDENAKQRILLTADAQGAKVGLGGDNSKVRVGLATGKGGPGLVVSAPGPGCSCWTRTAKRVPA